MKVEPIEYLVTFEKEDRYRIEKRRYDLDHWVVRAPFGNNILSNDLEWVFDFSPSYHSEEFVAKTRFSLEEALEALKKWKEGRDEN